MKKIIPKLTILVFFILGYSKNSSAQVVICTPPDVCSPDPCYVIDFNNHTGCTLNWVSLYPPCSENPGITVYPYATPTWIVPCAKCDDNPNCECPTFIKLVNPGVGYVDNWGAFSTGTWNPASYPYTVTYNNIPYNDSCCPNGLKISITIYDPTLSLPPLIEIRCAP